MSLSMQAQTQPQDSTLNRTVVVEQEYNPDIMNAVKVNVLPEVPPVTVSKKPVNYATSLLPADEVPSPLLAPRAGKEKEIPALPGYARLGYGNRGNLDLYANYLFTLSDKARLNAMLSLDGMDGKLERPGDEEWDSHYYRTRAALDYTYALSRMDLRAGARFGLSNFNLLPITFDSKQKFTSGSISLGVDSRDKTLPLQFSAETNLMLYQRQADFQLGINDRETRIDTRAHLFAPLDDRQDVGVELRMNNFFFTQEEHPQNDYFSESFDGNRMENYTVLNLNPYYRYRSEAWDVRLGLHIDPTFGLGKKLQVAPDVTARYTLENGSQLYAGLTGGRRENDFRQLEVINPYARLSDQLDATYEQLNATLGYRLGSGGFWMNLYGGYQSLKNDLTSYYEPWTGGEYRITVDWSQGDTENLFAGLDLAYNYKEVLKFSLSALYRSWSDKDGEGMNIQFKPTLTLDLRADVRPMEPLLLSVGYHHVEREKQLGLEENEPVSNLYLQASYELFRHIAIYLRAGNLLNRNYQLYAGYPAQGINFLGGVTFRF